MSADLPHTGPDNKTQAALLAPASITLVLGILLYGTRIRTRRASPLVWTDGAIGAALTLAILDLIFTAISCHYGVGRHTAFIDTARTVKARHFGLVALLISLWSICLAKCSIAWTVLQARQNRTWIFVFGWIMFVQVACTFATTLMVTLQCRPISALWDESVVAQCWSPQVTQMSTYVTLGFSIFTTLLLSLTPVTFVWGTKRSLHELIALGLLTGLGLFITVASVANVAYLHTYRTTQDPLHDMVAPMTWWQVEQNLLIIVSLSICLKSPYEALLSRCGVLICRVNRRSSSSCHRLHDIEEPPQMLKSLRTTIQWGAGYDPSAHLPPSITKTTEVVHSTEEIRGDALMIGSPARRPSWL